METLYFSSFYATMPEIKLTKDLENGCAILDTVLIDAEQNQHTNIKSLLDTGAISCVISPALFEKIKSKPYPQSIRTKGMGQKEESQLTYYDNVYVLFSGFKSSLEAIDFVVMEIPHPEINIILGITFLQKFLFLYNSPRGKFTLSTYDVYSAKPI